MAIPLSPEEEARIASYYGGSPGVNMSSSAAPAMSVDPASAPAPDPASSYYGPPSAPVVSQPPPPSPDAGGMANEFKLGAQLSERPMAPPPPVGPTNRDNAEFEAFKAKQAKPAPAKAAGSPSPSTPANPDPYGIKAADKQMVGSYDTQRGATTNIAQTEADRVIDVSGRARELARRRQEDIEHRFAEEDDAAKRFDASISEVQRQLDDVRSKKVKPLAFLADNPGLQFASILGGIFGGLYQGLNHLSSNPFLDDLNKMIDRQASTDERNIDNERATLGQKMNLLAQQRATFKDATASKLAMKNLYYEAMKDEIAAEASKYDSPLYLERGRVATAEIDREQGKLMDALGKALQAKDAAAAAQYYARMKEVRDYRNQVYDKVLAAGYTPAQAEVEANRQTAVVYAPGTAPHRGATEGGYESGGMTKEQRGKVAMEHQEAQVASDEFNSQFDVLMKHPVLNELGIGTAVASKLGQRVAPGSSKTVQSIEQINTQVLQAIGKVAKDADGKPNKVMIEKLEERFQIHPSDTKEIAVQKLEGARDTVNALARQQGATGAPAPHASVKTDAALGAKPVR